VCCHHLRLELDNSVCCELQLFFELLIRTSCRAQVVLNRNQLGGLVPMVVVCVRVRACVRACVCVCVCV
jgi:hypothetical protein